MMDLKKQKTFIVLGPVVPLSEAMLMLEPGPFLCFLPGRGTVRISGPVS